MIVSRIIGQGIKGRSFEYELTACNAIVGPNFAGKTAVLEAIRFACSGRLPDDIKRRDAHAFSVAASFSPGGELLRSVNDKGTVTTSGATQSAELIDLAALDVPLLEPERYFGMTERERTQYVFERLKLPGVYTVTDILAEIERLSFEEEHSSTVESAKADLVRDLRKLCEATEVQDALALGVEKCREQFTYWNRRSKETQGAVVTLTELKLREKEVAAAPADLTLRIEAKISEVAALNQELGALARRFKDATEAAEKKEKLKRSLENKGFDHDKVIERIKEEIKERERELEPSAISAFQEDFEETDEAIFRSTLRIREAEEAKCVAERVLQKLAKLTECPFCQSNSADWKESLRKTYVSKIESANATLAAETPKNRDLSDRLTELRALEQDLLLSHHQLDTLKAELKAAEESKVREDRQRAQWEKQLLADVDPLDAAKIQDELSSVRARLTEAEGDLMKLTAARTAETRLQQDLARAGEAAAEHEKAAAHVLVIKRVGKLLEARRESLVREVFTKLLVTANRVVDGILRSPLELHEGTTIGRFESGTFVPHHWFSGTEKAIAYIAIAVALTAKASFRLVLLDEFGRLAEATQIKVLTRLIELVEADVIDQFIVSGTDLPHTGRSQWSKAITVISVWP